MARWYVQQCLLKLLPKPIRSRENCLWSSLSHCSIHTAATLVNRLADVHCFVKTIPAVDAASISSKAAITPAVLSLSETDPDRSFSSWIYENSNLKLEQLPGKISCDHDPPLSHLVKCGLYQELAELFVRKYKTYYRTG